MVWVLSFPKVPHICHVVEVRQTVGKESGQFAAVPSTNDRPSTDSQSINNFRSSSRRRQIVVVVDFPSRLTVTFFFIMMMRQSIIFVLLSACSVSSVSAFLGQPLSTLATRTKTTTAATTTTTTTTGPLFMGGGSGYATSPTGKREKVARIHELLSQSEMVFSIPAGGMTVAQQQQLRQAMPDDTICAVVKNTLLERAVEETDFTCLLDTKLVTGPNLWFFIQSDVKGTMTAYKAFLKDAGLRDTHGILGGALEGMIYDEKGVEAIGQLPSKKELYAQIAGAIKAVPTKVARVIKEPGNKLARAIKLATEEDKK